MKDGPCVIVCRICNPDVNDTLVIPFESYAERGKWAAAHRRGTGHDSWICLDMPAEERPS